MIMAFLSEVRGEEQEGKEKKKTAQHLVLAFKECTTGFIRTQPLLFLGEKIKSKQILCKNPLGLTEWSVSIHLKTAFYLFYY